MPSRARKFPVGHPNVLITNEYFDENMLTRMIRGEGCNRAFASHPPTSSLLRQIAWYIQVHSILYLILTPILRFYARTRHSICMSPEANPLMEESFNDPIFIRLLSLDFETCCDMSAKIGFMHRDMRSTIA